VVVVSTLGIVIAHPSPEWGSSLRGRCQCSRQPTTKSPAMRPLTPTSWRPASTAACCHLRC